MTMPAKTRRWCQESPSYPISTKIKRNALPIIALFAATILAVSFFSYMSFVATHPNIQVIQQPDVPSQPAPNTSPSTESNASKKQPVTPVYQQPLPPDYPLTTPTETHVKMLETKLVFNEQGEPVLQVIQEGSVIAEYTNVTVFVAGSTIESAHYFVKLVNGTIINVTVNWP